MNHEKQAKLRGLKAQEKEILFYLVEDVNARIIDIAQKIASSEGNTRTLLTGIYTKLDIQGNPMEKREILVREYGEDFSALYPSLEAIKRVEDTPSEMFTQATPERRVRPSILIVGILGGFLLISIIVIAVLLNTLRSLNQGEVESPIVQATSTAAILATVPDSTSEAVILPSVTNTYFLNLTTQTPNPTSTPSPVFTSTNTPTTIPTPKIILPFYDNFNNGINPPWEPALGRWLVTSSGATITIGDDDDNGALVLDDPSLTNYRLAVDIYVPHVLSAAQGNVGVVVRYDPKKEENLMFLMNSASRFFWGYLKSFNQYFFQLPKVTGNQEANIISNFHLVIEVNGNQFTTWVDGTKYDEFTITGYEKGGIALVTACGGTGSCPSFSNVSLEALP